LLGGGIVVRTLAFATVLVILLALAAPALLLVEVNHAELAGPIEKPPAYGVYHSQQLAEFLKMKGIGLGRVAWATKPYVTESETAYFTVRYSVGKEFHTKYVIMGPDAVLYECDVTD
jgi:hypothetical protein